LAVWFTQDQYYIYSFLVTLDVRGGSQRKMMMTEEEGTGKK
jgi:hypothetical protein